MRNALRCHRDCFLGVGHGSQGLDIMSLGSEMFFGPREIVAEGSETVPVPREILPLGSEIVVLGRSKALLHRVGEG